MTKHIISDNIKFYEKSQKTIKKIILSNLPKNVEVYLFGSGVTKNHSYNSDIDIAIIPNSNFDERIISRIKDLIEESYVPFKVDIINLRKASDEFKEQVFKKAKKWR